MFTKGRQPRVDPGRPAPRHPLQIRPLGRARAADRPAAPGAALPHRRCPSYSLKVTPSQHFINWQQDPHGNWLARLVFPERPTEFTIEVDLLADLAVINPFDFFVEPYAEEFPFTYAPTNWRSSSPPISRPSRAAPLLEDFVELDSAAKDAARSISSSSSTRGCSQEIRYVIRMEPGVQAPDETLTLGSGSCRDSAWLLVQIAAPARSRGAFRLRLSHPAEGRRRSARRPEGHRTRISPICTPGPRSICPAPAGSASTRPRDCSAAKAICRCAPRRIIAPPRRSRAWSSRPRCEFGFEMRVERIREAPRVTAPFSDEAWARLDALGEQVDADLDAQDVRLTMGGEPTFVSIDDFEGAEWNTAAVGPTKRALADDLIRRLRERFAPGGFLHYGQGKWYPGESLPRWAFALYWRTDGKPIWRDPELVARLTSPRASAKDDRSARDHAKGGGSFRARRWSRVSASTAPTSSRPTRTRCIGCVKESGAADQRRSVRSQDRRSGGTRRMMRDVRTRPDQARPASSCRSSAGTRAASRSGLDVRDSGRCGAASCFWRRAIRRSACGCR